MLRLKSPRICPLCLKPLPKDKPNTRTHAGNGDHVECLSEVIKGLKSLE